MSEEGQATEQPVLNQDQAVQELAGLMQKQDEKPRDEAGKFKAKEEPKTEEAKSETEAPPVEEEAPAEEVEEAPVPRRLKLKYKGEDREVDETEAVELAQKGYDYTQKSMALAKEREELQARVKAESEQSRKSYEQQLATHRDAVLKLIDQEAMSADLSKLAETDPMRALQLNLKRDQVYKTLQAIEAEQQKASQQRQSEFQEAMRKQAMAAKEKLQERVPGWNNDLYGKILKTAVDSYGFDQQEANAITDHRAIEVLNDARQWREYQAAKPKTVDKRVVSAPKVQKPGGGEKPDPKAAKTAELKGRFEKSGGRDDAVAYIEEMIKQGNL